MSHSDHGTGHDHTHQADGDHAASSHDLLAPTHDPLAPGMFGHIGHVGSSTETLGMPDPLHPDLSGMVHHTDASATDLLHEPFPSTLTPHLAEHSLVVGTPAEQDRFWFAQHEDLSCGPAAVAEVISHYTGFAMGSESSVIADAYQHHIVEPDANGHFPGSTPELEVQMLADFHIPAHVQQGSVSDLVGMLAEGKSVILSVDPSPIWHTDPGQGHALLVTGIDLAHGTAILSDTGDPYTGEHHVVSLTELEQAWSLHDHKMVVTDTPAGVPDHVAPPAVDPVQLPTHVTDVSLPFAPAAFTHDVHHHDLIPAGAAGVVILPMVLTGAVAGVAWLRSRQDATLEPTLVDGGSLADADLSADWAAEHPTVDTETMDQDAALSPTVADLVDEVSSED